jgi:hypothetical protein
MSFSILALIVLAFAILAGAAFIIGSVLVLKENKVLGFILLAVGILVILCPIALYGIVLLSIRGM